MFMCCIRRNRRFLPWARLRYDIRAFHSVLLSILVSDRLELDDDCLRLTTVAVVNRVNTVSRNTKDFKSIGKLR